MQRWFFFQFSVLSVAKCIDFPRVLVSCYWIDCFHNSTATDLRDLRSAAMRWHIRVTTKELPSIVRGTIQPSSALVPYALLVKPYLHQAKGWVLAELCVDAVQELESGRAVKLFLSLAVLAGSSCPVPAVSQPGSHPSLPRGLLEHGRASAGGSPTVLRTHRSSLTCLKGRGICPQLWKRYHRQCCVLTPVGQPGTYPGGHLDRQQCKFVCQSVCICLQRPHCSSG